MRICIATPFYPPEAGALGVYAEGLHAAFTKRGDTVAIVSVSAFERKLPIGLRHFVFFLRVLMRMPFSSFVLALDTWSVGVPASFAARLFHRPFLIRIGGDFLWESYVERTKQVVRFSEFYEVRPSYTIKERVIFSGVRGMVRRADTLLFTTRFQREIWQKAYGFSLVKTAILENFYPRREHAKPEPAKAKVFVCAGRHLFLKNTDLLEKAFAKVKLKHPDISLDMRPMPHDAHEERVRNAYAVIVPSISEISSNFAIDALRAMRPFICTEDTGTSERLNGCGIFVDTRSEDALAAAIESLLDPKTYETYAANSRSLAFTHTWDDIAEEILRVVR